MGYHVYSIASFGEAGLCRGGGGPLNRNQRAAARRLSLAAYLLFNEGRGKNEASIAENLPPYENVYESSLGENGDHARAGDALRKQLARDVDALADAGIRVEVAGEPDGRRYRLPPGGFSPVTLDLTGEERAVLVGALRLLRRDFPYAGPLHLAVANLIGAASAGSGDGTADDPVADDSAFAAAVATGQDEEVSRRVGILESALARRKRVRFDYYSISRDETTSREVEPYALSLLDGTWYATGRDVGRGAVRQFRLSRIRSRITFVTRREAGDFEEPEDFERRFAGPRAPWQLGEPDRRARIGVSSEAFAAAIREYPQAVSRDAPDETDPAHVLSTPFSGERQLAGWILSLGEGSLVLSPPPLLERVTRGLGRIVETHASTGPEA